MKKVPALQLKLVRFIDDKLIEHELPVAILIDGATIPWEIVLT